jgi:acetyl/propionyl-CoA carboxylase alpha subunit/acetyl-CoA carboxylase carboxyltransferase component
MSEPFRRIAIVNRGEPAMRLVRAAREWSHERADPLHTIALFTEPDRGALFVQEADEAHPLGSATFVDEGDGQRKNRYLDYGALEQALLATRAEAAWVGWGFVAEHAAFAELCRRLGVVFIGPDPETTRRLGDKIASKRLAEEAGVPVAAWSGGPVENLEEARRHAQRLGFPLMVKATAGGGGRGIRRVRSPEELADALASARSEALKSFGDGTVFMERLLEGARHVEVQIIGDGQGTTWALGVRDCTIQRRNQKVVEESPSPALTPEQHRELCEAAARLGGAVGYRNAGTVEFLYEPSEGFSFMEVNARLQVEHPVTEETTGLDLVKLQIHVARGGRLEGEAPPSRGHSIEVRVTAEDPERGFAPAPGLVELLRLPGGAGIRVDTGFVEGERIAPEFDSMLAKVVSYGRDRAEALARLRRALLEMRLAVRGGANNKGFLLGLLSRPEVEGGRVDVGWLDGLAARGEHLPDSHADVALLQAAVEVYDAELAVEQLHFQATAARGRPRLRDEVGRAVELRHRGASYKLGVFRLEPHRYRIQEDGVQVDVRVERTGRLERRLCVGEREYAVMTLTDGPEQLVEVNGIPHRFSRDDAGIVRAPSPAVVLALEVRERDEVAAGDRVAVLEAMKTELPVLAPFAGRVRQVLVAPGGQVDAGAALLVLESLEGEVEVAGGKRISLAGFAGPVAAADPGARCRRLLEELRCLVLGFDVDPAELGRLRAGYRDLDTLLPADDADLIGGEDRILDAFTDVCALFRRRSGAVEDEERHSSEEYLHIYLRAIEGAGAGLPVAFLERLRRVLEHYGVTDLERTPQLDESLLWICKAQQRMAQHVEAVLDILDRRLERVDELRAVSGEADRQRLDRVVSASRGRFQAVSDLAREVLYRYFDRPFFERVRADVYADVERQLARAISARSAEREEAIERLVGCPEPLVNLVTARFDAAEPGVRTTMLEVLVRRYYRHRAIEDLETREVEGSAVATAHYVHEGMRLRVVAACTAWDDLAGTLTALRPLLEELPAEQEVLLDLFLWRPGRHLGADETERALQACYAAAPFPRPLRRLVAAVAAPGYGPGMSSMQHFTHRPADGEWVEERPYRGLHPMMGKRLQLWRTANFEIARLPSVEDVYLFHGVARSNPRDDRLFAFAEVRDVTPERDEAGRIVRLPRLEMMLTEALAAIRLVQSRRPERARLLWNRVLLYVWQPLRLSPDDLSALAQRLAPATEGLGLEKVVVRARMPRPPDDELHDTIIQFENPGGREVVIRFTEPGDQPIRVLSAYAQKVVRLRRQGLVYPYELIRMLTPADDDTRHEFPPGDFDEYDLDEAGALVPVEREPGLNRANLVVGIIRNRTALHPEGMARVILLGDPSREMGSFAEPECRRIMAAVDLAERERVPLEWFAVSAGAKIAMDSGTENLDWTAAALRRLIEFTQSGGEVNILVPGINVGGQSYWNAEATMLMHDRGILVMTAEASMVLTGKRALDYSGGVSAEDHPGIGGYERIMGRNGEAQYWASDIGEACRILFRYYEHSYVTPGERFPRRAPTSDAVDRDISSYPHGRRDGPGFDTVGDVFSEKNRERKRPFDIRAVMRAVIDQDHAPLERWRDMFEAEVAVVWDARLGGYPVCLIGFESHNIARLGYVPIDGPDQWTAGTLFPLSSKKVARAINAASGNRPVVILANLSGFDGSPESMRRLQLEYGAEIGRAVVNFRGPIVFCVVSRYHGGAYVVFSRTLNESLEVAALEGSYASVIGGAPAAAVVFAREVDARTRADARLTTLEEQIGRADDAERGRLRTRWHEAFARVHAEKLAEVAEEFEKVHSVHRALQVGSLHQILPHGRLRPYLVEAVERGIARELEREPGAA